MTTAATATKKNELKLIITGCGSSGTRYLAAVLAAAGFNVGHEVAISLRGIELPKKIPEGMVEVSWLATSHLTPSRPPALENCIVWHVVRNPLRVANTFRHKHFFQNVGSEYLNQVKNAISLSDDNPELDYWIEWNALAAKSATKTIQIETVRDDLGGFLKAAATAAGKPFKTVDVKAAHQVKLQGVSGWPQTFDPAGYARLGELIDVAKSYGYDLGIKKPRATKAKPKKAES